MRRFLCVLLPMLALAPLVHAEEASCYTTSEPEVTYSDAPGGALYVDIDNDPRHQLQVWIYQESNDIPGLQRDDSRHSDVEACREQGLDVAADALIW